VFIYETVQIIMENASEHLHSILSTNFFMAHAFDSSFYLSSFNILFKICFFNLFLLFSKEVRIRLFFFF
jgi:hypothetical protein